MAKVFAKVKGAVLRVGSYGEAANDTPAIVPDEVAAEFEGRKEYRVERDPGAHKARGKE